MRKLTNQNKLSILVTVLINIPVTARRMGGIDFETDDRSLFMGIGKGESYELSE